MALTPFPGERALQRLRELTRRAAARRGSRASGDPLGLAAALAATGAEALAPQAAGAPGLLGVRVPGREAGPPWLLCTHHRTAAGLRDWRPNAHGSGTALLLTLLECLRAAPPAQDVLCLSFPLAPQEPLPGRAAEAWAARGLLPLRGVLAVWQVAAPGLALELDVRSLTVPAAQALTLELFALGRALGHAAFTRGTQLAFPGLHVPFLERGLPALPLCAATDPAAGSPDDTLAHCAADSLAEVGATLLRYLQGERVV